MRKEEGTKNALFLMKRASNHWESSLSFNRENRMKHPLERIAIVNRGEAALRLIRAVRELNREQHTNLITVAFFTELDRQSLFVREADEAISIGPATFVDRQDGQLEKQLPTSCAY